MTRRKYIEATTDWESDLKRGQDALVVAGGGSGQGRLGRRCPELVPRQ